MGHISNNNVKKLKKKPQTRLTVAPTFTNRPEYRISIPIKSLIVIGDVKSKRKSAILANTISIL